MPVKQKSYLKHGGKIMVVQHNLRAMNSNRMLGLTANVQSKSTEKLSSGYKINRAADDAAGLSISEKMRRQIRGLSQASLNASDGISAVQTAEGALNEVQDMLQRMNELAVKASNGTMSEDDRSYIQNEISQLETEINRVAETTKFNETYMLKGGNGTKTEYLKAHDAGIEGELVKTGKGKATFTMDALEAGDKVTIGGKDYTIIKDAQTEAVADTDYTYKAATNAYVDLDLSGWTGIANDGIQIGNMAAAIVGTAASDLEALVTKLNEDTNFAAEYKAELVDEENGIVRISALDHEVTAEELEGVLTSVKINNNEEKTSYAGKAVEPAESSLTVAEGVKLYAANGDKELTVEEALAELDAGKKVYVDEAPAFEQTEAVADKDYTYNKAYSSVTIDLTGWQAADTVTIAGITSTAATGTDLQELVDDLNDNETFAAKYEASLSEDGKLVVKSYDEEVTAADIKADFTGALIGGATKNTAACEALTTENEPVEESLTTPAGTKLYAVGGTEALTEEEILAAIKNGDKLFTNSAKREESEITIDEAYEKVKAELLKANQIGDTAGTAKVEFAAAAGEEAEKVTADDFAAGDVKEIDGTEYTVADKTMDEFLTMIDEIDAAAKAGTDTTAIKISFTDANGKEQEFTITPVNTAGTANGIQQTKTDGGVTTVAKTLAQVKEAIEAAGGLEISISGGAAANGTNAYVGDFKVAGDDVEGATVVSAEKMAELVNAAATTDTAATGKPSNVFEITTGSAEVANTLTFNLHVGADADMTNKINVGFEAMTAEYLGIAGLNVSDSTGLGATYAVDAILDAIQKVSTQRSALGAVQNRLEHTIANLDNVVENTTAAESQIRDTDMATEMVKYSNNNILAQAGQAMLAQANQANQGVLSLLG